MKKNFLLLLLIFIAKFSFAQIIADPTTWTYSAKKIKANEYDLHIKVALKPDWHIWSLTPGGDGSQMAPEINFDKNKDVEFVGSLKENGKKQTKKFEGIDGPPNNFYENNVEYFQHIKVKNNCTITGTKNYQVCDHTMCLPPKKNKFSIEIKDADVAKATDTVSKNTVVTVVNDPNNNKQNIVVAAKPSDSSAVNSAVAKNSEVKDGNGNKEKKQSNLMLLIQGIGGGLASIITPCVFAMLPMTVSFFLKRSKDKKAGVRVASL